MSELTDRLWDRFGSLRLDDVPPSVGQVAKQCILDWWACAVAGSREPLAEILRDELAGFDGPCTLVGSDRRAGPLSAAMINGATGHALDFDDTHTIMGGHPTAPLFPAALALAQEQNRSGADLLTAFIVGFEIESQLGSAIGDEHYRKGWHQTSTIGVFGACAAAAWLLGLDHRRFSSAMGNAASSSSGLKANFGTMTKPFHAGSAAERGLLAARLAARGFTANGEAIDGNQGLAQAAGSGSLRRASVDRFHDGWLLPSTLFKYHAACYLTHAGIEATRAVLDDLGGASVVTVEKVTLTVNPSILDVCGIADPTDGLEAKFSLRGTQALTLAGVDTGAIASFTDGPIRRPEVRALVERVSVEADPSMSTTQTRSSVITRDGTYEGFHDSGVPERDLDLQARKLADKFTALAGPILGDATATAIATLVAIDELDDVHQLVIAG
jgi:2-methylcitrate dehydratase PrpD